MTAVKTARQVRLTFHDRKGTWTEDYIESANGSLTPDDQNVQQWAQDLVDRFNQQRRQHESERFLDHIEVSEVDVKDEEDDDEDNEDDDELELEDDEDDDEKQQDNMREQYVSSKTSRSVFHNLPTSRDNQSFATNHHGR